ncbi:hypothetical protein [Bacillus chungangensis]|uniref:Flagellar biosynthesis/type III secretory pathway M-ring protein FliF/YscJ n=1 Tax=Bacillus chungangensis TaxID=587633 RepID=A0ABT9WZ12_9BACI|nr:hypothetical protein [Bacillus chungangensis]MDQ0178441.1 flagellar biosynthesis/type III secretory pathway M-ring protein FliF/YscJ [Bacillus chungangensis]
MLQILQAFVLHMPFLYFPEDKSEYIPAVITMAIFLVIAVLAFRLIIKISKKQEEKTRSLEEQVNRERHSEHP